MTTEATSQATRTVAEIMNHYDLMVKPALEEKNFIGIQVIAQTDLMSLESSVMKGGLNPQIRSSLKMGLTYLVGLSEKGSGDPNIQPSLIDSVMDNVERYFSEVELGLGESADYKEIRIKE